MSKAKKAKKTDFWNGHRREFRLNGYAVMMSRGEEKRFKMNLEMPISNQPVIGMPDWISNPWQEMEKEGSLTTRVNIEALLEGMTIDIFPTDKAKRKNLTATGVMLTGFSLQTTGEAEKKITALHLVLYVPGSLQVKDWTYELLHKTFYGELVYSQTEMDFDGEEEDSDDLDPDEGESTGNEDPGFDESYE